MDSAINGLAKTIVEGLPECWGDLVVDGLITINLEIQVDTLEELIEEVSCLDAPRCRVCGCTDDNACPGGCYWVEEDLCSECVEADKPLDPKIKVVFVPAIGSPEVREIPNYYKAVRELIGGHFEATKIFAGKDAYVAIVDEEGKLKNLEANFLGQNGDVLVGPVVVTKSDCKGEFVALDDRDVVNVLDRVELGRLALGLPV